MSCVFEVGSAYFATPTIGGKKRLMGCFARENGCAVFTDMDNLKLVPVGCCEGKEHAIVKADDGKDYFVSASVKADLEQAAEVMDILKRDAR